MICSLVAAAARDDLVDAAFIWYSPTDHRPRSGAAWPPWTCGSNPVMWSSKAPKPRVDSRRPSTWLGTDAGTAERQSRGDDRADHGWFGNPHGPSSMATFYSRPPLVWPRSHSDPLRIAFAYPMSNSNPLGAAFAAVVRKPLNAHHRRHAPRPPRAHLPYPYLRQITSSPRSGGPTRRRNRRPHRESARSTPVPPRPATLGVDGHRPTDSPGAPLAVPRHPRTPLFRC